MVGMYCSLPITLVILAEEKTIHYYYNKKLYSMLVTGILSFLYCIATLLIEVIKNKERKKENSSKSNILIHSSPNSMTNFTWNIISYLLSFAFVYKGVSPTCTLPKTCPISIPHQKWKLKKKKKAETGFSIKIFPTLL